MYRVINIFMMIWMVLWFSNICLMSWWMWIIIGLLVVVVNVRLLVVWIVCG